MQQTSVELTTIVQEIACDRCGLRARRAGEASGFNRMTSIGFTSEQGSIFGQGRRVEIDLCEECLRSALGGWLRVGAPAGARLDRNVEAISPALEPSKDSRAFPDGPHGLDDVFRALAIADADEAVSDVSPPAADIGIPGAKLWTTTVEYGASGEGETIMAWIGHAEDAAEAKAELIKVFNEFHGAYGVSVQGVARNSVTELLFSEEVLRQIEHLGRKATVRAHAMLHFNRS